MAATICCRRNACIGIHFCNALGRVMPDALEKLKQEAPKPASRGNGPDPGCRPSALP